MFGVRGLAGVVAVAVVASLGVVGVSGAPSASAAIPVAGESVDLLDGFDLRMDGAVAGDRAGFSVAAAGDVNGDGVADVIVGARRAGNNTRTASGSAYVVYGRTPVGGVDTRGPLDLNNLTAAVGFRIDGAVAGDYAGSSVAGAGDVNGDGVADVIVGALYSGNNTRTSSGSAYVVYGHKPVDGVDTRGPVDLANLTASVGFRIDGAAAGAYAGYSVAGAGDVNGDGVADVIVGALYSGNNTRTSSGSAYVVYGRKPVGGVDTRGPLDLNNLTAAVGFRIDGGAAYDYAGYSVAGAGDVNGDGVGDVIVGAYDADNNTRTASGSAYVVYGRKPVDGVDTRGPLDLNNLTAAVGFRVDGAVMGDYAGSSVAGAGDVNGDGVADVIVGASSASNNTRAYSGSAYVVYGHKPADGVDTRGPLDLAGLTPTLGFRIDGAAAGDYAGTSVAGAGDANGDGVADVIVGANYADNNTRTSSGAAYVVYGHQPVDGVDTRGVVDLNNLNGAQGFRIDGAAAYDYAGSSVAGAGDVNGDGVSDVIVGAYDAGSSGRPSSGSAYVVLGGVNQAPVAGTVGSYSTLQDTMLEVSAAEGVLVGATDSHGDPLIAVLGDEAEHGSVDLEADGSFTYTPDEGYVGTDSFTFTVSDGELSSDPVTVSITVLDTIVSPVVSITGTKQVGVELTASGSTTTPGASVAYEWFHGQTSVGTGEKFTPDDDLEGESLTVKATFTKAGYATKTVTSQGFGPLAKRATAPVATGDAYAAVEGVELPVAADGVLVNDTDANGDVLTAALVTDVSHGVLSLEEDGSFTYTATEGYVGTDSFTYQAVDPGGLRSTAVTVTLPVTARPDFTAPSVAIAGVFKVGEVLTAVASSSPVADGVAFEWFHGTTLVGTGATFTPGDELEGESVSVKATLTKAGYKPATVTSVVVGPLATRKAPTVRLSAKASKVRLGQPAGLSWSSTRATSVTATGAWSGALPGSGSRSVKPANVGLSTYGLSATNANGTVRAQVVIGVSLPKATLAVTAKQARSGKVRVTVRGLAAREAFAVRVGAGKTVRGTASAAGVGRVKVTAPGVRTARKVAVRVTGSMADRTGFVKVRVVPRKLTVKVASRSIRASDAQALTVKGLGSGEQVRVAYQGRVLALGNADERGRFVTRFEVGQVWGRHQVTVKGMASGRTATASFTVTRRCPDGVATCA